MKDKILSAINIIIMMTSFGYIGFRIAQTARKIDNSEKTFLIILILGYASMAVGFIVHIILHEGGHLIAGIISGYKFVSFRIGSLALIMNKHDKLELRKMTIMGTGGQCLMCPPDVETEKCPYKLYHSMGGLTNIFLGLLAIIFRIILPNNLVSFCFLEIFGVIGIALGLTNLIPAKNNGIQNDGYNLIDLKHNLMARECMNLVLSLNAQITVADSYDELPKHMVDKLKHIDFTKEDTSNCSIANAFNIQAGIYFAEGNYEKAHELQKYIANCPDILPIFKNEAKCECLFFEIINGSDSKTIDDLYDKKLQKYITATSIYPARNRLMYAYYKLYKKDEKKASEYFSKLEKSVKTYIIKADALMELDVAKNLSKSLCNNTTD